MVLALAVNARVNALRTEVIVAVGTGIAMVVFIWNRTTTVIAVDAEHTSSGGVRDYGSTGVVRA